MGWRTVLKARESEVPSPFKDGGATTLSSKSIGGLDDSYVGIRFEMTDVIVLWCGPVWQWSAHSDGYGSGVHIWGAWLFGFALG